MMECIRTIISSLSIITCLALGLICIATTASGAGLQENPSLMSSMQEHLSYLGERQAVLADNVANANTPKYKGKDLEPFNLKQPTRSHYNRIGMKATNKRHIQRSPMRSGRFKTVKNDAFETSPDGNNVTLDEEMLKVSENNMDYKATTGLYRKWGSMLKMAIRGSQ